MKMNKMVNDYPLVDRWEKAKTLTSYKSGIEYYIECASGARKVICFYTVICEPDDPYVQVITYVDVHTDRVCKGSFYCNKTDDFYAVFAEAELRLENRLRIFYSRLGGLLAH